MQIELTQNHVMHHHPQFAERVVAELRNSSSVNKDADPSKFTWTYSCAERIGTPAPTVDDRVERMIVNISFRVKHWRRSERVFVGSAVGGNHAPMGTCPTIVRVQIENSVARSKAAQAEMDALTPEQRNTRIRDSLSELRGTAGFVMRGV